MNFQAQTKAADDRVDIMFVDDEAVTLVVMAEYFKVQGFKVATALDAREALLLSDRKRVGLMVIDLNLAGEDGVERMSFLKANHPGVPAIIYTGSNLNSEQINACQRRGADRFVKKEGSPANRLAAVQDVRSARMKTELHGDSN